MTLLSHISHNKKYYLLFITAFLILFTKLWHGYFEGDESCYATLSREVLRTNDWLVLHHPYYAEWSNFYEHPPLNMLMMAVSFKIFGISDHASKMVSALLAFGTILLTFLAGKKLKDAGTGYIAAFILMTTHFYMERARAVFLDVPFGFFLLLAFYFLVLAVKDKRTLFAFLSGLAAAPAFLTKGIPAFAIVAVVFIGFFAFIKSFRLKFNASLLYLLGLLCILLPWTWAQLAVDEGRFFDWYLYKQVAQSMAGRGYVPQSARENVTSYFYYIEKLFTQVMVPWFLFAILGMWTLVRSTIKTRQFERVLVLLAAVFLLLGFSLVKFRQASYIIPALPYFALLAADFFTNVKWCEIFQRWAHRFVIFLFVLLLALGLLTPLPFASRTNNALELFAPIKERFTSPGDTVLVMTDEVYAMRHMISWYWDRPFKICSDPSTFQQDWQTGEHAVAVARYNNKVIADLQIQPLAISGNYAIFLQDSLRQHLPLFITK